MNNAPKMPVIGITMGDPAGIGPEIVLSMLSKSKACSGCIPLVIGSATVLDFTARSLGVENPCVGISDPGRIPAAVPGPLLLDIKNIRPEEYTVGRISKEAGRASVEYVLRAVELALKGRIHAMVTAPINKEAIHFAGYRYAGHTELIAEKTGVRDYAMMLIGGPIRVILVTTHLPLRNVPENLTTEGVFKKIRLAHQAMRDFGFAVPKIAVTGLNPHNGEGGIFGDEEERIIAPAVARAREKGMDVLGPLPPDTIFYRAYHGEFHAVVCMYHDQGLIPLKMIAFDSGVNVTLGLPIIRTSVDHGTAFEIAGKGVASPESLIQAVRVAVKLTKKNR